MEIDVNQIVERFKLKLGEMLSQIVMYEVQIETLTKENQALTIKCEAFDATSAKSNGRVSTKSVDESSN